MTIRFGPEPDTTLAPALLRLAAGASCAELPRGADAALLRLTATPLAAFGRLVAPLVTGLRVCGAFDTLAEATRRELLQRRDEAVRADLVARRFLGHRLLPGWPSDLPVSLVKGAALNGMVYADDGPRRSRDLDLVVPGREFFRALQQLEARGGRVVVAPGRRVSHGRSFERTVRFDGPTPVEVDLHAAFVEPGLFRVDEAAVWARTVPWPPFDRAELRTPSPGDALVHLALHAFTHARLGARTLVDAHRLLTRQRLDQALLPGLATDWRAATPLFLLLAGACDLLDTPVDPHVLAALKPPGWKRTVGDRLLRPGRADARGALPVGLRRVLVFALLDEPRPALHFLPRQAGLRLLDLLAALRPHPPR